MPRDSSPLRSSVTMDASLQKKTLKRLSELNSTLTTRLEAVLTLRSSTEDVVAKSATLIDDLRSALQDASSASSHSFVSKDLTVLASADGTMGEALTILSNLPSSSFRPMQNSPRDVEAWSTVRAGLAVFLSSRGTVKTSKRHR